MSVSLAAKPGSRERLKVRSRLGTKQYPAEGQKDGQAAAN
jgi:hypothetical protein